MYSPRWSRGDQRRWICCPARREDCRPDPGCRPWWRLSACTVGRSTPKQRSSPRCSHEARVLRVDPGCPGPRTRSRTTCRRRCGSILSLEHENRFFPVIRRRVMEESHHGKLKRKSSINIIEDILGTTRVWAPNSVGFVNLKTVTKKVQSKFHDTANPRRFDIVFANKQRCRFVVI